MFEKLLEIKFVWEHRHLLAYVRNRHHRLISTVANAVIHQNTGLSFPISFLCLCHPPFSFSPFSSLLTFELFTSCYNYYLFLIQLSG